MIDFTRRDFLKTAAVGSVVGALSPSLLGADFAFVGQSFAESIVKLKTR